MFGHDRTQLRRFFQTSWQKHLAGQQLQPLERLVSEIVAQHPEYHQHLGWEEALQQDFSPDRGETNPWLHMALHVTLGEQLGADRPAGVRTLYQQILARVGERHAAEHAMMECLGMALWEAQRSGASPDDSAYLACLRRLAH